MLILLQFICAKNALLDFLNFFQLSDNNIKINRPIPFIPLGGGGQDAHGWAACHMHHTTQSRSQGCLRTICLITARVDILKPGSKQVIQD